MSRRPVCAVLGALALTGCGAGVAGSSGAVTASRGVPRLAGSSLYVNPENPANAESAALLARGDTHDAELLQRIASRPVATWFAAETPELQAGVHRVAAAAAARGQVAVIVAYQIPHRDCGAGFSSGGSTTPGLYLQWIRRLAAGIGKAHAVVILEPDSIPDLINGCVTGGDARTRLELLSQAITLLKRTSAANVYLDAGNAAWIRPAGRMAAPLRSAGVSKADGFALNVANFQSTSASVAYGEQLSRDLGGAHFVIDTSRNGNGPDLAPGDSPRWCNPPGRALGRPPTTTTGVPRLDALLWIKPPGASDGSCRAGAPAAGQWWQHYALELAAG